MIKILIIAFIGLVLGLSGCPQQDEVATEEEELTVEEDGEVVEEEEEKENGGKHMEHPGDLLQDLIN